MEAEIEQMNADMKVKKDELKALKKNKIAADKAAEEKGGRRKSQAS